MTVDSLRKNLLAYLIFLVLSVFVGIINDVHRQIVNGGPFDYWLMLDAGLVVLAPIITNMVLNMKLPSVGHEVVADKVADHEERLKVTDPAVPPAVNRANDQPDAIYAAGYADAMATVPPPTPPPAPEAPAASVPRGAALTEPVVAVPVPRGEKG